jgi:7-cyano-7-deazaguanine synthase in queuosine biosynthesis
MRIDKVSLDVFVAVPDMYAIEALTAQDTARAVMNATGLILGPALGGAAIRTAETLTEAQWEAESLALAQGCGECDGCKARAEAEAEWAQANGFAL